VIKFVKDLRKLVVNKGKENINDKLDVIGDGTKTHTTGGVTTTLTTGRGTTSLTTNQVEGDEI
jgi:hypothetical protein